MKSILFYGFIACTLVFTACGSSKPKYDGPSPVDLLMRDLSNEKSYSIVLHDMQMDESKGLYEHKYKIFKNIEKDSIGKVTEWRKASEPFFAENLNNMGLELASKSEDGKVHKVPAPPGFNNAVGNAKYGQWQQNSSGQSFWQFYGQYMFMSSMMNMMSRPVYQSSYNHYRDYRSNPGTGNTPYYGNNSQYGTNSPHGRATNPSFFERKQQQQQLSSFKQKVASNPARYTRASRNGNDNNNNSSRAPRTSTRSGSSSRSSGGSFGK